jgi:hypothetical protein
VRFLQAGGWQQLRKGQLALLLLLLALLVLLRLGLLLLLLLQGRARPPAWLLAAGQQARGSA